MTARLSLSIYNSITRLRENLNQFTSTYCKELHAAALAGLGSFTTAQLLHLALSMTGRTIQNTVLVPVDPGFTFLTATAITGIGVLTAYLLGELRLGFPAWLAASLTGITLFAIGSIGVQSAFRPGVHLLQNVDTGPTGLLAAGSTATSVFAAAYLSTRHGRQLHRTLPNPGVAINRLTAYTRGAE